MTFQPGQSGNPAGRPRGSRNKRTIIAEKLLDDHAGDLTHAAIDLAKGGNAAALRVCMDRVAPPLRHRPLDFALPELKSAADAVVAANAILQGAARGEITIQEAAGLMKIVRGVISVLVAADRAKRSARLAAQDGADDQIIPAQGPHGAVAATTTQETTDDDLDRPFPPARSRGRAHDRAASAARSLGARARLRRSTAPHGTTYDRQKSIVLPGTSARLGSFCADPNTVQLSSM